MIKKLFAPGNDSALTGFGLLVLRLLLGLAMLFNHGLNKLAHFSDHTAKFPDPLGIGSAPSLALVTFAETAGAALLALGLLTRFAALTLVVDLGVAVFMVHKAASGGGELAFVYLAGYVALLIAGGGKFSVDNLLFGKNITTKVKSVENDPVKKTSYVKVVALLCIFAAIFLVYFYTKIGSNVFGLTGQAEDALHKHIESQSQGNIGLTGFTKIDGQTTEMFGVKGYNLSFEGEITFMSDGVWLTHNPEAGGGLTFSFSKTDVAFSGLNGATRVHSGDQMKIGGVMVGQKSEKSWSFDVGDCHVIK
jgi:putative oxidoreductase